MAVIIPFDIERTNELTEPEKNWVAIGNELDYNGVCNHSVIIISYNNIQYEFHYDGIINYDEMVNDYFLKKTEAIKPSLLPSFVGMCKRVFKKASPQYGYFTSDSYYGRDGTFHSDNEIGQKMTCVGFCLNVLNGFLEERYIDFESWPTMTEHPDRVIKEPYLEYFCKKHGFTEEQIKTAPKRISPLELITSCFFTKLPINKNSIDSQSESVHQTIKFSAGFVDEEE